MTETAPLRVSAGDGHRWGLLSSVPEAPRTALLWLPALGIGARHYLPFAKALAARGVATHLHEWRGAGSSSLRAGRHCDWGWRELLESDIPASLAALRERHPDLPVIIGGHSLGGQLACCTAGLAPDDIAHLWLVGSGAPWWKAFPHPHRFALPLAYRFLPWLADRCGALPGRRIGFGGREARGLMRDWSRVALTGTYAARGLGQDLEAAMARVRVPVTGVVLAEDWFAPESSLRYLLSKLPDAPARIETIGTPALGTRADHFAWMKHPEAVATTLAGARHPLSYSGGGKASYAARTTSGP